MWPLGIYMEYRPSLTVMMPWICVKLIVSKAHSITFKGTTLWILHNHLGLWINLQRQRKPLILSSTELEFLFLACTRVNKTTWKLNSQGNDVKLTKAYIWLVPWDNNKQTVRTGKPASPPEAMSQPSSLIDFRAKTASQEKNYNRCCCRTHTWQCNWSPLSQTPCKIVDAEPTRPTWDSSPPQIGLSGRLSHPNIVKLPEQPSQVHL